MVLQSIKETVFCLANKQSLVPAFQIADGLYEKRKEKEAKHCCGNVAKARNVCQMEYNLSDVSTVVNNSRQEDLRLWKVFQSALQSL